MRWSRAVGKLLGVVFVVTAPFSLSPHEPRFPSPASRRTVLVTGAGRRLGREIALGLAAGGWQVAVHYRSSLAEAEQTVADCAALSGDSALFAADLEDEQATRALLPAWSRFRSVDAVVHSAALFEHDEAATFGYALVERHARSNTGAAILLAQALHRTRDERATRKARLSICSTRSCGTRTPTS